MYFHKSILGGRTETDCLARMLPLSTFSVPNGRITWLLVGAATSSRGPVSLPRVQAIIERTWRGSLEVLSGATSDQSSVYLSLREAPSASASIVAVSLDQST